MLWKTLLLIFFAMRSLYFSDIFGGLGFVCIFWLGCGVGRGIERPLFSEYVCGVGIGIVLPSFIIPFPWLGVLLVVFAIIIVGV